MIIQTAKTPQLKEWYSVRYHTTVLHKVLTVRQWIPLMNTWLLLQHKMAAGFEFQMTLRGMPYIATAPSVNMTMMTSSNGIIPRVIKWNHFSFVRRIHRSPVNSTHKVQWRGALMFPLICDWINDWVNNREAGGLWRHRGHYDVNVMHQ